MNSIFGSLLAAGLGVLGLNTAADILFAPHYPEKPGMEIVVAETGGAEKADAAPKPIDWGLLFGDAAGLTELVARGEKVSGACKSCHTFTDGGANGTGPNLYGVVGRAAGSHAGFAYSEPMKAMGKAWDYDTLSGFLAAPNGYLRGTKMSYAGIKKEPDRVAMIAYLRSLSASPAAIPAPLPAEAPPVDGAAAAPAEAAPAPEAVKG